MPTLRNFSGTPPLSSCRVVVGALCKFGVYEMPPHSEVEEKPKAYSGLHHFYTARIP